MAYCSSADVLLELPWAGIADDTVPSLSTVGRWCDEIGALQDGVLAGAGLPVPATAPPYADHALVALRRLAVAAVASRVLRALNSSDEDSPRAAEYDAEYRHGMRAIRDRPVQMTPQAISAGSVSVGPGPTVKVPKWSDEAW